MKTFISVIRGTRWHDRHEENLVLFCREDGRTAFLSLDEEFIENNPPEVFIKILNERQCFLVEDFEYEIP